MKKTALVIQPAFLGDVILTTPLVESLFHEGYEVDYLVRAGNQHLLKGHPKIKNIIVWNKKKNKYWNWLKTLRIIRQNQYDFICAAHQYLTSGLWVALSGAKVKSGFKSNPLHFFFDIKKEYKIGDGKHETLRNLQLVEDVVQEIKSKPRLYPSKKDFNAVEHVKKPYITISPASAWFTKTYPKEKWIQLINKIPKHIDIHLTGGPDDLNLCNAINEATDQRCINQIGKISMLESIALTKAAEMNYVNDSSPLHMASAMNAPVTAFFLNTSSKFGFTPTSDVSIIRETTLDLECRPCGFSGKKSCPKGHFKCSEIEPNP